MAKTIFLALILFCSIGARSQNGYIVLKKGQKSIRHFWKDGHFTFRTEDGEWITGIITKISSDSFYLTKEVIRYYLMGSDTLHFSGFRFSVHDVYTLPTSKEQIGYKNDQVHVLPGHEKFMWVRNGFIFQVGGAGYAGLSIINDLTRKSPPFAKDNLTGIDIGVGAFLIGTILHRSYHPYLRIGKKYHLQVVTMP